MLIEVAAVDSGWRREEVALWCQPTPLACQPASPAGVQSPTPLALSSALPYIRQTLGLLLPTKHHCSTSFFCRVALGRVYIWVAFVTALSPGSRLAYGRLACHRAFADWSFRRVVHRTESRGSVGCPHLSACRSSHQVHQMHHSTFGKWDVCAMKS